MRYNEISQVWRHQADQAGRENVNRSEAEVWDFLATTAKNFATTLKGYTVGTHSEDTSQISSQPSVETTTQAGKAKTE